MENKEEDKIFSMKDCFVTYGNIEDSDTLSLVRNKKRLYKLRKYKSELIDAIDGTNPNWQKYLKDYFRLLEVTECDFLDCNKCIKNTELTEQGYGQLDMLITIIDSCAGK